MNFFIYFSGHGNQVKDLDGDEDDGFDECICLLTEDGRHLDQTITDDMLGDIIYSVPIGVKVISIFDCCHSGSILDLPYVKKIEGSIVQSAYRFIKSVKSSKRKREKFTESTDPNSKKTLMRNRPERDIILFSGCKDGQESTDAMISPTQSSGALTFVLLHVLKEAREKGIPLLYRDLLQNLLGIHKQLEQIPQLTTGYNLDINQPFHF